MIPNSELPSAKSTETRAREYAAYARTYYAVEELFGYLYERFRSDPALYHGMVLPRVDDKWGIILENA